ncbi:MAG: hypothetical protein ABGX16_14530 [Pirellulales bacterium]
MNNWDTLTNQENSLLINDGTLTNSGMLTFAKGSTFDNTDGTLNNSGTIESYIDNYFQTLTGGIGGTVNFQSGTNFLNYATITNASGESLHNAHTLTNSRDGTLTNNGVLVNDFKLINSRDGKLTNSRDGTLTNYDTLNNNQGLLFNSGTLNNKGTLTNGKDGKVQNRGTIDTTNGTFINYGTKTGSGHIEGSYIDHGHTRPGNSAGVMTINGDYFKIAGSKEIELGGLFDGGGDKSLTHHDWLDVTGNVELAGTLDVHLIDGFELAQGMSFNFLRVGGTLTGQYDGLGEGDLVGNFGGQDLFITYAGGDGNEVTLFTVPEPTVALTWPMLIGLAIMIRRRR